MRTWTIFTLIVLLSSCAKSTCSVRPGADIDIIKDSKNNKNIEVQPKGEIACAF